MVIEEVVEDYLFLKNLKNSLKEIVLVLYLSLLIELIEGEELDLEEESSLMISIDNYYTVIGMLGIILIYFYEESLKNMGEDVVLVGQEGFYIIKDVK